MKKNVFLNFVCFAVMTFSVNLLNAQNVFPTCIGCNVGIGTITPSFSIDVNGGEINLSSLNKYQINGLPILWHNGLINNIYVGVGAGNTNATAYNTFVGFNAGANTGNTIMLPGEGTRNTFVGHLAGFSNDQGQENSFFGDSAGYNTLGGTSSGYHNTFLGASSGWENVNGKSNTLVGFECGYNNTADFNTMVGRAAGYMAVGGTNSYFGKDAADDLNGSFNCAYGAHSSTNTIGSGNSNNSAFGNEAGRFVSGSSNCFFGFNSGTAAPNNSWSGYNNSFFGMLSGGGTNIVTPVTMNGSGGFGYMAMATSDNKIIIGGSPYVGAAAQIHVGIGLSDDQSTYLGPRSPLEINSDPASTEVGSAVGLTGSGLQFRQLTSLSPNNADTYIAPFGRVLTVDANGKVKLTDDQGNSFGYGICPNPTVLPDNIGMKLKDFSIYYDGQAYTAKDNVMRNAIGLGYPCAVDLPGKLSVDQTYTIASVDFATTAGYFHNGDITSNPVGHKFEKRSIYSICNGFSNCEDFTINNIAGEFIATNSQFANIAVRGRTGIIASDTYGQYGFGGYFQAIKSSVQDIGVCAISDGNGSNSNYGIYASAPIGVCNNGGPCSDAAGYFNGDVYTTSSAYFSSSDINLKDNIQPIQNSTAIVTALSPKTFSYRRSQFPYLNLADGVHGGLIAQEVQNILPQLVKSFSVPARIDSTGMLDTIGTNTPFLAVNYIGIIPYLIGAVKEQQQSIDSLRTQLQDAVALINNCCGSGQRNSGHSNDEQGNIEEENSKSTINVELSDANTIILDQNSPNPFSEETVIKYVVPKEVSKAIIMIYDNSGHVLKTITINERGQGSLHIYAEKLSSGIYSYTLIADGKKIDSKQMVCLK